MTTETKNRDMGPRGLPPQAPLAGVGADIKTPFWGGPNDGSAGPPSLAGPEGPMGPRIAASAAFGASVVKSPNGLVVKKYRRLTAYRVSNFEVVVGLIAELLFKISRIARGSVVYLNGRRMRVLLGLDAPIHPIDLSVVYEVLSRLGFEVVRRRGKAAIINMGHPLIKEIRNAENINDVIQVIRKHLGE